MNTSAYTNPYVDSRKPQYLPDGQIPFSRGAAPSRKPIKYARVFETGKNGAAIKGDTLKRNMPCHCGSGVKYKKCHYIADTAKYKFYE